ncbi:glutathione S-transferase T2-like [Brassica napus]|uniref:glutathione S-transferase T2-like n=1 Tax=Brassica napus TaxID=3708 RepID=UPI000BBE532A|nr:glutathione S-transferase T2-like [Brassica napus]
MGRAVRQKEYINMLRYVADSEYGIPKRYACGGRMIDEVRENEEYDTLPGKRFFTCKNYEADGLHYRQLWVIGVQEEIKRLTKRVEKAEQVIKRLTKRVEEAEQVITGVSNLNKQIETLEVCKFVGSYEAALKEQASGQNENDVMKAAHDIFLNDYQAKFSLEHAWRELRFDQKWRSNCLSRDGVKDKKKEAAGMVPDEEEVRPPGVKACKAAKRKKHGKEAAFDQLHSMLVVKENIGKQKLLDRLLARKDTLSDIEVSLKNKLVSEML